jgi:glutamyl-Q tRNA(Asp) synthetase
LLAALASALDAIANGGDWLLRIEDLDPQRCRSDYETLIRTQLSAHGLAAFFVGEPVRQQDRGAMYREALQALRSRGYIFACDCSRKTLAQYGEPCCNQDCRSRQVSPTQSALRADLSALPAYRVIDRSLGDIFFDPARHRDVVVWRRDDVPAYHLAVVVDDAAQGVTDVVRGADLSDSVPWQTALQRLLGLPQPRYLHVPVLTDLDGTKLSKRDHAAPLLDEQAIVTLTEALGLLNQPSPPKKLAPKEIIVWAAQHWQPKRFVGVSARAYRRI